MVVPVFIGAALCSLQFITPHGGKYFLENGEVKGGYFAIGTTKGAEALCVAEGFATGATVHEATGHPVAVAYNCGNLLPVAETQRKGYPELSMILCADNDVATEGNPGLSKAVEAARGVGAKLAVPIYSSQQLDGVTDFNDLGKKAWYGSGTAGCRSRRNARCPQRE